LLGTYRISDTVSVSAGLANTLSAGINNRDTELGTESYNRKAWMASIAVTAPDSAGALAGSTLYGGVVGGFSGSGSDFDPTGTGPQEDQVNYYLGATIATPVAGLKFGAAFDYVSNTGGADGADTWVAGIYASYQATEKMSLHGRFVYGDADSNSLVFLGSGEDENVWGLTGTLQYDLWANVVSRVELRYDNVDPDGGVDDETAFAAYLNLIYKF
jgi:hypothetical protein